ATSTTGHPCKTGAWRCGKQNPFPTSPHPRRRLRTKVKRGVTLTFYLVQNIGQVTGAQDNGAPDVYTYYDATGRLQSVQVNYAKYTQRTNFACSGSGFYDFGPATVYFPTSVVLADGETYQLSYEATPGYPNDITGRLAQITLPNKGYIAYGYSGNACGYPGFVQTLTRT